MPTIASPPTIKPVLVHGMAAAMALDHVALAMAVLAGFTERRIARLVDTRLSDLPAFLTRKGGLNSGMMILQYVAADYASQNKVLAHPASGTDPHEGQLDYAVWITRAGDARSNRLPHHVRRALRAAMFAPRTVVTKSGQIG